MSEAHDGRTTLQWERLRHDVAGRSAWPSGSHLDDEVFIRYSMGALSAEALAAADEHLASCGVCATQLEHLLMVSSAWQGSEAERRLDNASRRIVESIASEARPEGIVARWWDGVRRLVSFGVPGTRHRFMSGRYHS